MTLSKDDFKRFLSLYPYKFFSFHDVLPCTLKYRSSKDEFLNVLESLKREMLDELENVPKVFYEIPMPVMISVETGKLMFNFPLYISSLAAALSLDVHKLDIDFISKQPEIYYKGDFDEYVSLVKESLHEQKKQYNEMIRNDRFIFVNMKEMAIEKRSEINFLYKNLDKLISILSRPLDEKIESYLEPEKFLFLSSYLSLSQADFKFEKEISYEKKYLPFIEGYTTYLKEKLEEDPKFSIYFTDYIDGKKISISTTEYLKFFESMCVKYPVLADDISSVRENIDYKEVFKDLYRQKRINSIRQNISVSWEFMPKGDRTTSVSYRSSSSSMKKESYANNGEELLKDKEKFFNSLPYIATFNGINHFEGYIAYVFENGKVVFEKFYERVKGGLKPAVGNAIYIMDIEDFATLSKLDKTEIRKMKDKVKAKNHTKTFQQRVLKEISAPSYNDDVLDYIDSLIEKAKEKENERLYQK